MRLTKVKIQLLQIKKLQKQPNSWSCLPTAFAMVLGMDASNFISKLDHDGSDIIHPDLEEPYKRRSFHIQEMIDICWLLGYTVTEIQATPTAEAQGELFVLPQAKNRLEYYLQFPAVLIGTGYTGIPHAVAWDGSLVCDPNGSSYTLDYFQVDMLFLITKINITN